MKIYRSKRGTEVISNWPFWIMFAMAVGAVVIIIVKIGNVNVAEAAKILPDLEELILVSRFYNSEKCLAYQDDIGRVYTHVLDVTKFNDAQMEKCFPEPEGGRYTHSFSLTAEQKWFIPFPEAKTSDYPIGGEMPIKIKEKVFVFRDPDKYRYPGILTIKIKDG